MKFTVITPENLEMSRLVMSVVKEAIGGEKGTGGSISLVSNTPSFLRKLSSLATFIYHVGQSILRLKKNATPLPIFVCTGKTISDKLLDIL